MRNLILLACFLFSLVCSAEPQNHLTLYAGGIIDGESNNVTNIEGAPASTSQPKARTRPTIGGEYRYLLDPNLSASGVLEYSRYRGESQRESDTLISAFAMPGVSLPRGALTAWFGLGLGLTHVSLGLSSASTSTTTLQYDSSTLAFAFSPRVGFDWRFTPDYALGIQGSYFHTSYTLDGKATILSSGQTYNLSTDVTRSWYALALRFVFHLGSPEMH